VRRRETRLGGCDHCIEAWVLADAVERRVDPDPQERLGLERWGDGLQEVEGSIGLAAQRKRAGKVVAQTDVVRRREQERLDPSMALCFSPNAIWRNAKRHGRRGPALAMIRSKRLAYGGRYALCFNVAFSLVGIDRHAAGWISRSFGRRLRVRIASSCRRAT
jgi:hypothetical protein